MHYIITKWQLNHKNRLLSKISLFLMKNFLSSMKPKQDYQKNSFCNFNTKTTITIYCWRFKQPAHTHSVYYEKNFFLSVSHDKIYFLILIMIFFLNF